MTGPLAPLFARVREALGLLPDIGVHGRARTNGLAALSAIERHTQDMEKALEPFARDAEAFDNSESTYGDGSVFERLSGEHHWRFTIADVRRARAARPASYGGPDGPAGTPEPDAEFRITPGQAKTLDKAAMPGVSTAREKEEETA